MHSLLLVTEARRTDLIGDRHPAATEEDCVDELRLEWARAGHPRTCGHDPRRGQHLRCGVNVPSREQRSSRLKRGCTLAGVIERVYSARPT